MDSKPLAFDGDSSVSDSSDSTAARYQLVMRCADGSSREFKINRKRFVIGRLSRSDVQVALPMIGPRHCELVDNGNGLMLTDLGSEIGTLVNGQPLKNGPIRHGDRIGVGPTEFTLHAFAETPTAQAQVTNFQPAGSAEIVVLQQPKPRQSPIADV